MQEALPALPKTMQTGDQRAKAVERASTDAVEAAVMASRVGDVFTADVVDVDAKRGRVTVQLTDPAIVASAQGEVKLGRQVQVRVESADIATGSIVRVSTWCVALGIERCGRRAGDPEVWPSGGRWRGSARRTRPGTARRGASAGAAGAASTRSRQPSASGATSA